VNRRVTVSARAVVGLAVAVGVALGTIALSRIPYDPYAAVGDGALLRLSWRARAPVVASCRPLTEEERATIPAHMQRPEVCERQTVPYVLEAWLDGRPLLGATLRAEGDSPLYVFREASIPPGPHRLRVAFRPQAAGPAGAAAEGGMPPARTLEAEIRPAPREIVLVRLDEETGRLEVER